MSQNPQKTISKAEIKNYNQFKSVRTEALIWLQITTNTGKKLKVETEAKERYQKLIDLITNKTIKFEHQNIQNKT